MEMASAHGLALKLVEMNRLDRINRNECEIISEEDRIIKSWLVASNQRFSRLEYVNLTRKTLLFVLSQSSLKEMKKKELLRGVSIYFNKFSSISKSLDIRRPLIDVIVDPWKNTCFSWEELFQKRITVQDKKVQEYFCSEPEEIVLARVHWFLLQGKDEMAMTLAKSSFLYHSRIAKHLLNSSEYEIHIKNSNPVIPKNKIRRGRASMDWYLFILQKKKSLPAIFSEIKQLTCHEGVLLVQRLRRNKNNLGFIVNLLQLFLMQELIRPSKFCCTKKIFSLWCILHKEQKTSMDVINQEIRKIMVMFAPSSAHFYLLVDALWEQFGSNFITLYVELYVRGLTVDLNHLEAAKHGEVQEDKIYLESHIASMFTKLSALFSDFHEGASRECMFSAFSLKPTQERLYILQSLTHSILSAENEIKSNSSLKHNPSSLQECKCAVKCTDTCKSIKEHFLEHPILMKGIPNVPYCVVKDLVSVLESVRCVQFQYNLFDWHNNAIDLGDYLRDFALPKSWDSDTEYASEGSVKSDEDNLPATESFYATSKMDIDPAPSAKRKSESGSVKEMLPFEVGENVEMGNNDFMHKRIKVIDKNKSSEINKLDIFNTPTKQIHHFNSVLGMEDAIENVIRMTLDNSQLKSDPSVNSSRNTFVNPSLNHANDGTENFSLSSVFKHTSENHVYPYSLTSYGKKKNLTTNYKISECTPPLKSGVENSVKYAYFTSKPSQVLISPHISRQSVISPGGNKHTNVNSVQEQSCSQIAQSKFLVKTVNAPCYTRTKNTGITLESGKKIPVYQQEAYNLGCKSAIYEPTRNASNAVTQGSQLVSGQTAMQVLHASDISVSNFSKAQCLPKTSVTSSSTMTSPINLIQSKGTVRVHSPSYSPVSHVSKSSSVFRNDSRYQLINNSASKSVMKRVDQSVSCFQDNQFVHCDRSSVIQHTMQHVGENVLQNQPNDIAIPNQLAVSVNSNAAEQIRNVPKNDVGNLPPFTVNVTDRTISNSNLAVSANFVIARKPQPQIEVSSPQSICSDLTTVNSTDTITIPGILASPSVIVSPWEAQRKVHGEMLYKKNANAVNVSTIDKRIYKNRVPYGKPLCFKPELKMIRQKLANKANTSQVSKAVSCTDVNFHSLSSISQSNTIPKQNWTVLNKSSTQANSPPTSSQPWYSEPYPKSFNSTSNVSPKSNGNFNISFEQSTSSTLKMVQPTQHTSEVNSLTVYNKQVKTSNNHPSAMSTVLPPFNNTVPSLTKSSVLNVGTFTSPKSTNTVSNKNTFHKDAIPSSPSALQSNSMISIKTYTASSNPVKSSPIYSSHLNKLLLGTGMTQDKKFISYKDASPLNLHQSQDLPKNYPNSCCSPSEMNPCQNCSLSVDNNRLSSRAKSDGCPEQQNSSEKNTILENDVASPSSCNNSHGFGHSNSNINASLASCQYCSHPFLESELQVHMLNCPSKEFGEKNSLIGGINSNLLLSENFCTKPLLDIPEQNSLFQEQSFQNNIPHVKPFLDVVENPQSIDDKNLYEIEANAFNVCMDLINNDKDLKRIVQGIGSLDQLDNNYLPFLSSTDSSNNFLSDNLCNEIKVSDEVPLQKPVMSDKSNGFNNYSVNQEPLQSQERPDGGESYNSVFEFKEKESKSVQKLIHSKPQTSYAERISVNRSKISNELTFSAVSEMIKVTVTECSHNELEAFGTSLKDKQKEISASITDHQKVQPPVFSCPYCSKKLRSAVSIRRHIFKLHPHVSDSENFLERCTELSPQPDKPYSNFQLENVTSGNGNSYNDSQSINCVLLSDKQNSTISNTCEISGVVPKGRIKGLIKSPTSQCKFCGKTLTSVYMRKHILKQHQEIIIKSENSSSDLNLDVSPNSSSQIDLTKILTASPLLEQDIDSSTCLSMSDALRRNSSYSAAETTSNVSETSDKFIENTDVKFNFNVLELSKNTKIDYKLPKSEKNIPLEFKELAPENADKFEEKIKANISCTKQNIELKYPCNFCKKSYASFSILNRHLKTIHKVTTITTSKKNKVINVSNEAGINVEGNKPLSSSSSNALLQPNNHEDETFNKKCTYLSKIPYIEKLSHATVSVQKIKEKHKSSTAPNLSNSLLKAVLQSNFVSKHLEKKGCNESKAIASVNVHNTINDRKFCDSSKISETHQRSFMSNVKINTSNCCSENKNYENSKENVCDAKLISNKVSVAVPFKNQSKTETSAGSENCLHDLILGAEICNSSLPSGVESTDVHSEFDHCNENSQIIYSDLTNSQNLSIQSNEISPISEIISNVSKCQFGGTSNIGNERECFEDNSLKLLIPESEGKSKFNIKLEPKQEFLGMKNCVSTSVESDKQINKLVASNSVIIEKDIQGESCELIHDLDKNCIRCRLCHQSVNSMEILSKHLKEIHDIPVLKKHISQPCFADELAFSEKPGKLSPPKLKLGTNESESESDLDNPHSWPQPINSLEFDLSKEALYDSSELETSKGIPYASPKLETCKETLYDSLELDVSKEVPCALPELDTSNEAVCDSSELDPSKEILYTSSELETPEDILCDSSESDASKDILCNYSEITSPKYDVCDSSELNAYKNEVLCDDNFCSLLPKQGEQDEETIVPSSSCKLKKSYLQLQYKDIKDQNNSLTMPPLKQFIPNLKLPKIVIPSTCKNKFRRHSFGNIISMFSEHVNPLIDSSDYASFDSNKSFCTKLEKCSSLPNLKIKFQYTTSQIAQKVTSPNSPFEKHTDCGNSSEDTSFSSVTDNTEICKSSCDSSSSSSSSPSVHLNKFTINSSFILRNPLLNSSIPRLGRSKTILRSKFSGRKLIIQRLKTYENQKKNKKAKAGYFTQQEKNKTKKTFNPIILTLKKTTEVSEFLKTHKQPFVKLIRLKENEFDHLLNHKNDSVSEIICNKYDMKEAVVKLERMTLPCDIDKMVLINQKLLVPNMLSQNAHNSITMQNHQNESINCPNSFYLASDNACVLPKVSVIQNPPEKDIELSVMSNSNSSSSDSVQFLGTVTKQEICQIKTDFCSAPSTKKCFVVLNRVSI